jgi:hypothetical protein
MLGVTSIPTPPHEAPHGLPASASFWRVVTLAVVFFALANALYSAWHQGWTYDEPFHLEWSERLLTSRDAGRESPHYNSKTPVMLPNVLANLALRRTSASEPVTRFASRLTSVVWLALLLATVFALGRALFGLPAARIATVAAALDPPSPRRRSARRISSWTSRRRSARGTGSRGR